MAVKKNTVENGMDSRRTLESVGSCHERFRDSEEFKDLIVNTWTRQRAFEVASLLGSPSTSNEPSIGHDSFHAWASYQVLLLWGQKVKPEMGPYEFKKVIHVLEIYGWAIGMIYSALMKMEARLHQTGAIAMWDTSELF